MHSSEPTAAEAAAIEKARRELLLKVYDAALAEYRFNVSLGWDRTRQFLLLSSALVAAGVGLVKVAEGSKATLLFLAVYFALSIFINICGLETVKIGKEYYRESVFVKTIVERELGLLKLLPDLADSRANLSIAVTDGQRNYRNILFGLPSSATNEPQLAVPTITSKLQIIFVLLIAINVMGAVICVLNLGWLLWPPPA